MNRGVPPTDLKARTGEFTPPGITAHASANSRADAAVRASVSTPGCVGSALHMVTSVPARAHASTTGCCRISHLCAGRGFGLAVGWPTHTLMPGVVRQLAMWGRSRDRLPPVAYRLCPLDRRAHRLSARGGRPHHDGAGPRSGGRTGHPPQRLQMRLLLLGAPARPGKVWRSAEYWSR